jgi:DNA invertase Pin-like site-specific DNA recombinase
MDGIDTGNKLGTGTGFSHKIKAAIYCRVSTLDQLKDDLTVKSSLQSQEARCRRYIAEHDFSLDPMHVYVEPGVSAELFEERFVLQKLLDAARAGQFNLLVVRAGDRIARDQAIYFNIVKILQEQCHVQIISLTSPSFAEDPDIFNPIRNTRLIAQHTMDSFVATYQHALQVERLQEGKRAQVRAGRFIFANPPFGYKIEPKMTGNKVERVPIPDPVTYWVLEALPTWTLEDNLSLLEIAERLDSLGVPTIKGGRWNRNSVNTIIRNPFYAGKIVHGRRPLRQGQPAKGNKRVTNPRPETITMGDHHYQHPYDWETHLRMLEKLSLRTRTMSAPRTHSSPSPLAGLLKCGYCGASMTYYMGSMWQPKAPEELKRKPNKPKPVNPKNPDRRKTDYFLCSQHLANRNACNVNRCPSLPLFQKVWEVAVNMSLFEKTNPETFYRDLTGPDSDLVAGIRAQIALVEKELASLPNQRRKADDLYFQDEPSITKAKYVELSKGFDEREARLTEQLNDLRRKVSDQDVLAKRRDKYTAYVRAVRRLDEQVREAGRICYWPLELSKEVREILRELFGEVRAWSSKIPDPTARGGGNKDVRIEITTSKMFQSQSRQQGQQPATDDASATN